MPVYEMHSRVSYDDIDQELNLSLKGAMGQMQEAAILAASRSGYGMADIPRTGVIWILVQWRIKMVGQAHWNDDLVVETWPMEMGRLKCPRNFVIYGPGHVPVALGESLWVLVSAETGRTVRITPEVREAYPFDNRQVFETPLPELPQGAGEQVCTYQVCHRDIDTNHHMNNRVYVDVARDALPPEVADAEFREVFVRYHKQLVLGDRVVCTYRREGSCHVVEFCSADNGFCHATVAFYQ